MKFFYTAIAIIATLLLYQIIQTGWYSSRIDNAPDKYTIGNQNAALSVVEFISYNCPYCHEISPIIMEAVKRDGNIRYIPRPIGTVGDTEGMMKAILAYSAGNQGKFIEIQKDLFERFRPIDEDFITTLAETHTLDLEQFNKDFGSKKTRKLVEKNNDLFVQVKATSTPTFIIGKKIFYVPKEKMPTTQDFLAMFKQARAM